MSELDTRRGDARPGDPRRGDPRLADSVLRAIDFVERRLGESIGVEDMARAACYSPFYFSRLFVQATGHSPYDYLMRRRVAVAAEATVESARSLTEIALECGFEAPDSFARAFRRCFGLLPSEARKRGDYPRAIARTRISARFVEAMLGDPPGPPEPAEAEDLLACGDWAAPGGAEAGSAAIGSVAVVRRGPDLRPAAVFTAFIRPAPPADHGSLPAFPRLSTRLPGGPVARFRIPAGEGGLETSVEFAYRVWLPVSGGGRPPEYDMVEPGEKGPAILVLPLASRAREGRSPT